MDVGFFSADWRVKFEDVLKGPSNTCYHSHAIHFVGGTGLGSTAQMGGAP